MKRIVIMIFALAFLLTSCGESPAQETVAADTTIGKAVQTEEPMPEEPEPEEPEPETDSRSFDWDAEDAYILAKIAMAEAEDEDTEGKALVILVVLNRAWGDNEFPNTIEGVVFQKNQFSPVANGRYDSVEPDADCWKALAMVESGWDESEGALYFESRSDSTWHQENLKFLFQHGKHYFYTEKEGE